MFCRDAGIVRRKATMPSVGVGEDDRRMRHRVSTLGSTNSERRRERMHRQTMRKIMQQAQRLTGANGTSGIGSLSAGVCFRASRRSYPDALLVVSDVLAEAQVRSEAGQLSAARRLDTLAERIALHSGFEELLHLVWAYDSRP